MDKISEIQQRLDGVQVSPYTVFSVPYEGYELYPDDDYSNVDTADSTAVFFSHAPEDIAYLLNEVVHLQDVIAQISHWEEITPMSVGKSIQLRRILDAPA